MPIDFLKDYIKLIVAHPDDIQISSQMVSDTFCKINIKANSVDIGKIIGKNGNMINAIKTIINGCKAKDGISYKLQAESI